MWGIIGSRLHALVTRVQPPKGGVLTGSGILLFKSPSPRFGNVLSLNMKHVVIEGIGFPCEDIFAPLCWADVPRRDSSVKRVPMGYVLFLPDEVKVSPAHNDAFSMMAFTMRAPLGSIGLIPRRCCTRFLCLLRRGHIRRVLLHR